MRPYELVVLLHPDLEIDVDTPLKKVENLITNNGGKVTKRDNWGKRRLAYTIKKQLFAIYIYFEIDMEPGKVRALEQGLGITEEVIRHLLVSHVEFKATEEAPAEDAKAKVKTTAATESKEEETTKEG